MVNTEMNYTYKPPLFRLLFNFVCLPILLILLGWGTRLVIDYFTNDMGDLGRQVNFIVIMITVYAILNFAFLVINKNQFVVMINPESVSGPSSVSLFGNQKTFPIDEIDIERLRHKTLWEKLLLEKAIRGKDGKEIMISRFCYSREQEEEIIEKLLSFSKKLQER